MDREIGKTCSGFEKSTGAMHVGTAISLSLLYALLATTKGQKCSLTLGQEVYQGYCSFPGQDCVGYLFNVADDGAQCVDSVNSPLHASGQPLDLLLPG